jgi:hypothetical protein
MLRASNTQHGNLIGRVSGITLRVGALLLTWGLLIRDDAGHHAVIWHVLQVVGLVMVIGSLPAYGWYVLTRERDGSRSRRTLPNQSQISRLLASRRDRHSG